MFLNQSWAIILVYLFQSCTPLIIHVPVRSIISPIISCILPSTSGTCIGFASPFPKLPSFQDGSDRKLPNPFRLKNLKVKAWIWQSEHFAMLSPLGFFIFLPREIPLDCSLKRLLQKNSGPNFFAPALFLHPGSGRAQRLVSILAKCHRLLRLPIVSMPHNMQPLNPEPTVVYRTKGFPSDFRTKAFEVPLTYHNLGLASHFAADKSIPYPIPQRAPHNPHRYELPTPSSPTLLEEF